MPVATEASIGQLLRTLMNNNGFSGVKIIGFEHNFNDAAGYPVQLMQQARTSFAGASFHCYSGSVSKIDSFRSSYPSKQVHLTECSGVYGSSWWGDVKVRFAGIVLHVLIESTKQWYIDNLFVGGPEHYGKSSMMWNLALDGNGQPMLPGAKSCGTACRGVVQINSNGTWSLNQECECMTPYSVLSSYLSIPAVWPIAHAGKAIAPKDAGGPFGQRIAVAVGGTYSWVSRRPIPR